MKLKMLKSYKFWVLLAFIVVVAIFGGSVEDALLAALSMLNILENFDAANPYSSTEFHRKIEAMKLAYADLKGFHIKALKTGGTKTIPSPAAPGRTPARPRRRTPISAPCCATPA